MVVIGADCAGLPQPFSTTLRRLSRRRLELTEFTERIDSALKIRSDTYLTRVYRKTLDRFAVPALKNRVAHKHRFLLDIYTTRPSRTKSRPA